MIEFNSQVSYTITAYSNVRRRVHPAFKFYISGLKKKKKGITSDEQQHMSWHNLSFTIYLKKVKIQKQCVTFLVQPDFFHVNKEELLIKCTLD